MKHIRIIIILLLSMVKVHAQPSTSPEDIIREKLSRYCELVPREEIYVHSDRNEYIAGEDLWFKIYLIDRHNNTITDHSSIAYVELINPDNRQIISKRIRLEKGFGPGHILLPDTLSSGLYIIRAYTNWMRNFLPGNCFVGEIRIHNVLNNRTFSGKPGFDVSSLNVKEVIKTSRDSVTGIKMQVSREQSGKCEITLITSDRFRSENKFICYLLIQTHGVAKMVKTVNVNSGTTRINVPEDIFIPGINQIVVFSSDLKPLTERLIFSPLKEEESLRIVSADTFGVRERVKIMIGTGMTGNSEKSISEASLSIALSKGNTSIWDIADYMVFGSEYGLLPESIRNHRIGEIPLESADSFLLNAESSWIDWNYVMSGKLPEFKYKVEKDEHFITGQLVQKITQEPLKGKYMFLSKPGKTATFQYSKTDSTGTFSFTIPVNYNVNDLIIQPEEPDLKSSVKLGTPFAEDLLNFNDKDDTSVLVVPEYILKWGVNYQITKVYGISNSAEPLPGSLLNPSDKRFYGKPDIEMRMKDYILLPLMEEVFFELTPGVQLKRKGNSFKMTIEDPITRLVHKKPPVLFIDGIVVKDPAVVAGLEPETVEKIDVIKDLYLVGDYIFFGIINIITKSGDFSLITLPEDAVRFKYKAVEPVPLFTSPDYSEAGLRNSRIPDFRNTLYWNPSAKASLKNETSVGFWTSDGCGSYEVILQGVNQNGEPVSSRKIIIVE